MLLDFIQHLFFHISVISFSTLQFLFPAFHLNFILHSFFEFSLISFLTLPPFFLLSTLVVFIIYFFTFQSFLFPRFFPFPAFLFDFILYFSVNFFYITSLLFPIFCSDFIQLSFQSLFRFSFYFLPLCFHSRTFSPCTK